MERKPTATAGPEPTVSRRGFLEFFLGGGIIALAAAVIYPMLRFITPPKLPEATQSSVTVGKVSDLEPNSGKIFPFGKDPGILIRTASGEYRAFAATCTHLDCTVQYRPDLGEIWCACHNGHYDLNGKNISGPPPTPLKPYAVAIRGEDIIVSKT